MGSQCEVIHRLKLGFAVCGFSARIVRRLI